MWSQAFLLLLAFGTVGAAEPVAAGDLTRALRSGESYTTDIVFDVDPLASGLILYITDADPAK